MTTNTISQISLDQLHESPFNPRKTFTDVDQLAASIRAEGGILSPLLVRPRTEFGGQGNNQTIADGGFEIVFGHRRYRAAVLAGLQTTPCMVRAMTDDEARSAQIAENLARADVHPIEEAEGFQAILDTTQTTADELAVNVGKSRSYVYGRLKLLQACPDVRSACLAGEIGSEVALLVARLRTVKLQEKALAAIRNDTSQHAKLDDGGKKSFRYIRDLLAEKFTLSLKDAIFDIEDEGLLLSAGHCVRCPKRVGNAPEFEDLAAPSREGMHRGYTAEGGANVCTDPDCFAAKKEAHLAREAAKLTAAGKQVVSGNKAKQALSAHGEVKGAFIAAKDVKAALKKAKATVKPVLIQDQRSGKTVEAYARADLVAAGLQSAAAKKEPNHKQNYAEQERRRQEERKKRSEQLRLQTGRNLALFTKVREVARGRQRTEFELRLVTAAALGGIGWSDRAAMADLYGMKDFEKLQAKVDTMDAQALTALLLDCAVIDNVRAEGGGKPGPLLALANHYGIDAKAVMTEATGPAADPATADLLGQEGAEEAEEEGAAA
jgi:ParB/RepB/Spo0J family partition protein